MARYGEHKYKTTTYGETIREGLTWALEIDWNGDGFYSGDNDAENITKLNVKRGRDHYINPNGSGFEHVKEGKFTATLLNLDGKYDPFNTSSPLYPHIAPNKNFRLRVRDDQTGIIYSIMSGVLEDIQPLNDRIEKVNIKGTDKLKFLKNTKAYLDLIENQQVDNLIQGVLDSIGWVDGSDLQQTFDVTHYWWGSGRTAYTEIVDLTDSILGTCFIAGDGKLKFYNRTNTNNELFVIDGNDILREKSFLQPWETTRNAIRIDVNSMIERDSITLWELQQTPKIRAGQSLTLWAKYTYANSPIVGKNIIQPVLGALNDFAVFANENGTGTELTNSCTVVVTSFGDTGKAVVTNNSASDGYITVLKIRGDGLQTDNVFSIEGVNQENIDLYGRKEFNLENRWIQDVTLAKGYSSYLKNYLSEQKVFPTIKMLNNPSKQFVDLFDRVGLNLTDREIDSSYYVGSVEHIWESTNGDRVRTTLKLEPTPTFDGYWTFPMTFGVNSIFSF